jgi:hypothetical protein
MQKPDFITGAVSKSLKIKPRRDQAERRKALTVEVPLWSHPQLDFKVNIHQQPVQ